MFKKPMHRPTALSLGVSLALGLSNGVYAQEEARMLEEAVVTATKRSASVQDVSVSVTAFSAEDLKRGGIEDLTRVEYIDRAFEPGAIIVTVEAGQVSIYGIQVRRLSMDINRAAKGIAAIQSTLRATQHLNTLQIHKLHH